MLKIVVHSHKGGPGKSTIASNLAASLAIAGKKVGIIDLDLAGPGLHVIFGLSKKDLKFTLSDVLQKNCTPKQATVDLTSKYGIKKGKLVFIPGAYKTESIVGLLQRGYELSTLRKTIKEIVKAYSLDYLLVDTRPGIDESTMLAIGLCDLMLLVTRIDRQDVFGTAVTLDVARVFKRPVYLVVNMIPPGEQAGRIEKSLNSMFHVPIISQLSYYMEVHKNLSAGVFVFKYPDVEFSQKMKALAAKVLGMKDNTSSETVYARTTET